MKRIFWGIFFSMLLLALMALRGERGDDVASILKEKDLGKRKNLVHALVARLGPEVALSRLASGTPSGEAHVLAHYVGEWLYGKYGAEALHLCGEDALTGCIHGVFLSAVEVYGEEGLANTIAECRKTSANLFRERIDCLHGAGHVFLAFSAYEDLEGALRKCDVLSSEPEALDYCYTGVFMENVFGEHNGIGREHHPWLSLTNPLFPCDTVEAKYRNQCYVRQSAWWYYSFFEKDLKKTASLCTTSVPLESRAFCARGVGYLIYTLIPHNKDSESHAKALGDACGFAFSSLALESACTKGIASSVFKLSARNLGVAVCGEGNLEGREECYKALRDALEEQGITGEARREACSIFPSGEPRLLCEEEAQEKTR